MIKYVALVKVIELIETVESQVDKKLLIGEEITKMAGLIIKEMQIVLLSAYFNHDIC